MIKISTEILQALATDTRDTAIKAGKQILGIYESDLTIEEKADHSPITLADITAHNTICAGLARLTPDIPILSEESSAIPFSERQQWPQYWLVDPLDGTREFIKRNGEFTVNIALIDHHEPVLGVIHVPVSGVSYSAVRQAGACKSMPGDIPHAIHVKATRPGQIVIAGSRSHSNEEQEKFIGCLGGNVKVMAIGSSLKFCLVAEGRVDIYPRFGPTSEWDTAAAQCIVAEAGGTVTDMNFEPLRYNTRESLINPGFLVIADQSFDWRPYLGKV